MIARCMGLRANYAKCQHCARLPREPKHEDAALWLNHETMAPPCKRWLPEDIEEE